jgi:hypothetical protein
MNDVLFTEIEGTPLIKEDPDPPLIKEDLVFIFLFSL